MTDAKSLQIEEEPVGMYPFYKYKEWEFPATPILLEKGGEKHFSFIKNFITRETDIIFCSAMKSGTHWVHEILSMLINQTTEYNSQGALWEMNLEYLHQPEKIEQITGPRIFHTHLPYSFLPRHHLDNGYKIVCLNRNPKDRYVSSRFFWDGKLGFPKWSWAQYFEELVLKDKLYTGWLNYTKEMTSATRNNPDSVFSLLYEDLLLEPQKQYTALAKFLGVPSTEEFIDQVVEKCSFKNLKGNKLDVSVILTADKDATCFRKGEIGDWKNWFTVAQNEQFDALYEKEMKDYDLKFIYDMPDSKR